MNERHSAAVAGAEKRVTQAPALPMHSTLPPYPPASPLSPHTGGTGTLAPRLQLQPCGTVTYIGAAGSFQTFYGTLESVLKPNLMWIQFAKQMEKKPPKVKTAGSREPPPFLLSPAGRHFLRVTGTGTWAGTPDCRSCSAPASYASEGSSRISHKIRQKQANKQNLSGRKMHRFYPILSNRTLGYVIKDN